jgi:hypothetical protein
MRNDHPVTEIVPGSGEKPTQVGWAKRLETTKVTIPVVVGFIALLAVFSLAAAGIGQFVHHLKIR